MNHVLNNLHTVKAGILFILCLVLSSCVATSQWLSSHPSNKDSPVKPPHYLAPIHIGVSTKEEVLTRLGNPVDQQILSIDGTNVESLSYFMAESTITPYQYLPLVGAVAFRKDRVNHTPSAAMSFSPEGVVSGLTLSSINAYGDIRPSESFSMTDSSPSFYGTRNPDVASTLSSPTRSKP